MGSIRRIWVVAKKELSIYFTTLVGYLGFGAYAFLMGLLFISSLNNFQNLTDRFVGERNPALLEQLNFNDAIITPMLSSGLGMYLFFIPFLTMRLFAEEKSARTFELLMTLPVRTVELVGGKFLSLVVMVGVFSLVPVVFPLILHAYGSTAGAQSPVEWWPVASGLGAIFLMGLTCASVGLLVSALAESQVVAAVGTFAVLLVGFVLPSLAGRVEGDWRYVLEYLTPLTHVSRGLQGRVRLADLLYFGSALGMLLFFTHRVVEAQRWR